MGVDQLPQSIRDNYEVHEWKHACAILANDFPEEWQNIRNRLSQQNAGQHQQAGKQQPNGPNIAEVEEPAKQIGPQLRIAKCEIEGDNHRANQTCKAQRALTPDICFPRGRLVAEVGGNKPEAPGCCGGYGIKENGTTIFFNDHCSSKTGAKREHSQIVAGYLVVRRSCLAEIPTRTEMLLRYAENVHVSAISMRRSIRVRLCAISTTCQARRLPSAQSWSLNNSSMGADRTLLAEETSEH